MDYRAAFEQLITAADGGNDGYALYNLLQCMMHSHLLCCAVAMLLLQGCVNGL
jgi:hypothetical protein